MTFEADRTLSPLHVTGSFSLSSEELLLGFRKALEPGHERELLLAAKLFLFWELVLEEERPQLIADVFALVIEAQATEASMAAAMNLKAGSPEPKEA